MNHFQYFMSLLYEELLERIISALKSEIDFTDFKKAKNDVQCGYFMVYNKLNSLDNVTMKRH